MLPSGELSTLARPSDFLPPKDVIPERLVAQEIGGIGISDVSRGLNYQIWTARYDGTHITIEADNYPVTQWVEVSNAYEISLTFDQNMRPVIAWTGGIGVTHVPFLLQDGSEFWVFGGPFLVSSVEQGIQSGALYWYNPAINDYDTTTFIGCRNLRVALDDKREMTIADSDVILTYLKGNSLYFRTQRDRYGVEYLLRDGVVGWIRRFGMNDTLRMQWEIMSPPRDATIWVPPDDEYVVAGDAVFGVDPDPVYEVPINRIDPCGECP